MSTRPFGAKRDLLVERLRSEIAGLKPGTAIDTERALAERFGVSRETVRQSLKRLQEEGLIYTIHGSGTYVAERRVTKRLTLLSFSEELRQRGMRPSTQVLSQALVDEALGEDAPTGPFMRLERVRKGNGLPMSLEVTYVAETVAPGLVHKDLSDSLYQVLRDDYDLRPVRAEEHLSPIVLNRRQATLLKSKTGDPALEITRIALDMSGREIERSISIRPGDRYDFAYIVRAED